MNRRRRWKAKARRHALVLIARHTRKPWWDKYRVVRTRTGRLRVVPVPHVRLCEDCGASHDLADIWVGGDFVSLCRRCR